MKREISTIWKRCLYNNFWLSENERSLGFNYRLFFTIKIHLVITIQSQYLIPDLCEQQQNRRKEWIMKKYMKEEGFRINWVIRKNNLFSNLLQDIMLLIKPWKDIRKYLIKLPKLTIDSNTESYQAFNIQIFLNPLSRNEFKSPD